MSYKTSDNIRAKNRLAVQIYYIKNKEKKAKYAKAYREQNRSKLVKNSTNWRLDNLDRSRRIARLWSKKNTPKVLAQNAKHRGFKKSSTPSWLTFDQKIEILEFYNIAREIRWLSEEKLHVDHIVPLRGKTVCGLHVPWNLQILPQSKNLKKSNKINWGSN